MKDFVFMNRFELLNQTCINIAFIIHAKCNDAIHMKEWDLPKQSRRLSHIIIINFFIKSNQTQFIPR